MERSKVFNFPLPDDTKRQLQKLAKMESKKAGERVPMASVVRRLIREEYRRVQQGD